MKALPGFGIFIKGMRSAFGKKATGRRQRHLSSQMKYFAGPKFKTAAANAQWGFANRQAKKYGDNGLFGTN